MNNNKSYTFDEACNRCQFLADTVFSEFSGICDRENRFPTESLDALKDSDLLSLLIPKDFGGWGLNFYQYQKVLSIISQGCPSTAAAFNMHNIVIGSISNYDLSVLDPKTRKKLKIKLESIFTLVVFEKKVFAAATTEPGIGARFSQIETSYTKDGDFYIINGFKSFVTMANYADFFLVLANKNSDKKMSSYWLTYFIVPRLSNGVFINETWDVLGMRGTSSQEVFFKNVKLPKSAIFMGNEGFALSKVMREPHWVTGGYLGVYLGILKSIFKFTCQYIVSKSDHVKKEGLAYLPLVQARIGEMYSMLRSAELNLFDAAEQVVNSPTSNITHQALFSAKFYLGELMPKFASMALRTCGGNCIHKKFPLERLLRDSHCGGLMPAVSDMCQIFLGKTSLDINEVNIW
ncbi:acyl-CoA dehydrogenase family protein [Marinomonas sp. TI.3.20]|uniref:acyl-CoA dehydrogenase family protein n=1 Tax=Marinomonas sp. TI.3.20 TaxID=3121296 RepID=UPI00311D2D51